MTLNQRKSVIVRLGQLLACLGQVGEERTACAGFDPARLAELDELIRREKQHNGWFTEDNVRKAMRRWGQSLAEGELDAWLKPYELKLDREEAGPKQVALIMAGNIPLVGLHDLISTFLAGHHALVKLSRDDNRLLPALLAFIGEDFPLLKERITLVPALLKGTEALIATGSNNSARHFDHYFASVPRLIRRNRSSLAILSGHESPDELKALGTDIFDYFGLGCRNVTKLLAPSDFDIDRFFNAIFDYKDIGTHNKYANNYDYHKALWLLNREQLLDNGFLLLKEDEALVSPVGSLFIQRYSEYAEVDHYLARHADEIQCVVGKGFIPFGKAQEPKLNDYADGVDTLAFLLDLDRPIKEA